MMTNEKFALINGELEKAIADNAMTANKAMKTLELMSPTQEQYHKASANLMCATFISAYLVRISNVALSGNINDLENVIRFHAYQLKTKSCAFEANPDTTGIAQRETFLILNGIVKKYLEE